MSPNKTTIDEVLEAVHLLSQNMDNRFAAMDNRFSAMENRFTQIDARFEQIDAHFARMDSHFDRMDSKVGGLESQMVTKAYLDDKLADLRGDLTLLTRKEDSKLLALVDLLYGKRLMTAPERAHIIALQPFARA